MSTYLDQVIRQRDKAQRQLRDAENARDGAYALPRRLTCRARLHNKTCRGNPACPQHGRRKR
ncbi:hypothetical protein [Kitasatospora sp. NPDC004272]